MKSVCAWCGRSFQDDPEVTPTGVVSHGICEDCAEGMRAELDSVTEGGQVLMDCSELLDDEGY